MLLLLLLLLLAAIPSNLAGWKLVCAKLLICWFVDSIPPVNRSKHTSHSTRIENKQTRIHSLAHSFHLMGVQRDLSRALVSTQNTNLSLTMIRRNCFAKFSHIRSYLRTPKMHKFQNHPSGQVTCEQHTSIDQQLLFLIWFRFVHIQYDDLCGHYHRKTWKKTQQNYLVTVALHTIVENNVIIIVRRECLTHHTIGIARTWHHFEDKDYCAALVYFVSNLLFVIFVPS